MDVKRHNRQWLVRWLTNPGAAPVAPEGSAPREVCARCDDGGMWIAVPDLPSMPMPTVVYSCQRCGAMTAHAGLPAPRRSIGD